MRALSSVAAARPATILLRHQDRLAIVYVRQSTAQQVERHQESTGCNVRLQTGRRSLAGCASRSSSSTTISDAPARASKRLGFERLVAEVGLGNVGLVLGVEVSRLARNCRDWHQLLELCALFDTLIVDADGVYDPANFNDRLVLGLNRTAT